MLSSYSILTATGSLFPTSSSGSMLQFLLEHAHTRTHSFRPLDLGCYDSSSKGCAEVSVCLFDESRRRTSPRPTRVSAFVCMCVMMINTFVLKANRELLCVCIRMSVCLCVSVIMCSPSSGCVRVRVFACLCASLVSMPRTLLAATSMIVVYSFDILHLVPVVHQPLPVLVRSF